MPIWLDAPGGSSGLRFVPPALAEGTDAQAGRGVIEVGLVNNMPDAALQATERQFMGLLGQAAEGRAVRMHLFSLPGIARGAAATAHMAGIYAGLDDLGRTPLHGLIVTGCEPRAASLAVEPYWESMTRLVDWAEHNTVSTLWSCLAAHAAVLHLDGIARRRLPQKRSGVFGCAPVMAHPLLAGAPARLDVPHSRWNDLAEADLSAHGYDVLTRSAEAGVDLFAKQWRSLFVFFQGHPEYDPEALAREYRRDIARFLRGERPDHPAMPHGYFDSPTAEALDAFAALARADPAAVSLSDLPRGLAPRADLLAAWQTTVRPVVRNWLDLLGRG